MLQKNLAEKNYARKCILGEPKRGESNFGQKSADLNIFLPNCGINMILTGIGNPYEYCLK